MVTRGLVTVLMTKANRRFAFNRYEENKELLLSFYKISNLMQYIKLGLRSLVFGLRFLDLFSTRSKTKDQIEKGLLG
jgi:hypothetical protein